MFKHKLFKENVQVFVTAQTKPSWRKGEKRKEKKGSLTSETMDGQRNCCWLGETILIKNEIGTEKKRMMNRWQVDR